MKSIPYTRRAHELLHQGSIALAKVEHNGIRIDEKYLRKTLRETAKKVERKRAALERTDVGKAWKKRYRSRFNLESPMQLGNVLFDVLKLKSPGRTKGGQYSTSEEDLMKLKHPFVQDYFEVKKLIKSIQFLKGIQKETQGGFLHPSFRLNVARTFRSSSSDPNFQNLPVRVPEMARRVRKAFIARMGRCLIEVDFSGVEVRIAACYHHDPAMIAYINNPALDMHRDMAMACYMLSKKEVTKTIRYCGKNMFVFPQFYGSYWLDCSAALWEACDKMKLRTASGIPLRKHLRSKGIKKLGSQNRERGRPTKGTFEAHIQKVENNFWGVRFPVYKKWKEVWYEDYLEKGWFLTKTGFICQGFLKRNQVINYPVQGSAFHLLLWALIVLQREIERRGLKTLIVGQIHDSIVADVPEEERDIFLMLCKEIMTVWLLEVWPWIIVPLEIEAEASPLNGSWADKKEVKIPTP
jgi:DNA polymerase-1